MIRKSISIIAMQLFLVCTAGTALAHGGMAGHFVSACEMWGTPPSLAMAIAKVESGMQPWAVNIQGKSYYPPDRESALQLARKAAAQKKSFDLGLMQINSFWLSRFGLDIADVIEPRINLILGCWILSEELKRYGLSWKAIGAYHTPLNKNPSRARAYANKVLSIWEVYK